MRDLCQNSVMVAKSSCELPRNHEDSGGDLPAVIFKEGLSSIKTMTVGAFLIPTKTKQYPALYANP